MPTTQSDQQLEEWAFISSSDIDTFSPACYPLGCRIPVSLLWKYQVGSRIVREPLCFTPLASPMQHPMSTLHIFYLP